MFFQKNLGHWTYFLPLPTSYLIGKDSSMIIRLLLSDHKRELKEISIQSGETISINLAEITQKRISGFQE